LAGLCYNKNMLAIYNTLTRKKEVFKPLADQVRWYSCGPTVYDFAHIGNLRMYIVEDVLGRWLKESNYKVFHVMNITDVDDKTIAGAKKMDVSLWEYTDYYFHAFLDDLKSLNILAPNLFTKATDHIQDMINLIKILLAKGFAYKGEDGSVYFSIEKSKNYGELAQLDKNQSQSAVRVAHDEYSKENSTDFALWKAESEADSGVAWDAPFGKGRPGWHIECSAMSMKYLGEHFDLHDGGVDLIFPHHSNEIAQSEGVSGKKFVNFWLEGEHLLVEGEKMAKSLGNVFALSDIVNKGFDPFPRDPSSLGHGPKCRCSHLRVCVVEKSQRIAGHALQRDLVQGLDGGQADFRRLVRSPRSDQGGGVGGP